MTGLIIEIDQKVDLESWPKKLGRSSDRELMGGQLWDML